MGRDLSFLTFVLGRLCVHVYAGKAHASTTRVYVPVFGFFFSFYSSSRVIWHWISLFSVTVSVFAVVLPVFLKVIKKELERLTNVFNLNSRPSDTIACRVEGARIIVNKKVCKKTKIIQTYSMKGEKGLRRETNKYTSDL